MIARLEQSGSEHLAYELCQALNSERFHVELLVRRQATAGEYYFQKLSKQGFKLHKNLPLPDQPSAPPFSLPGWLRLCFRAMESWIQQTVEVARLRLAITYRCPGPVRHSYKARLLEIRKENRFDQVIYPMWERQQWQEFFGRYDVIHTLSIMEYLWIQDLLPNNDRVLIHITAPLSMFGNRSQYPRCYPDRDYRFVLLFDETRKEVEHLPVKSVKTFLVPHLFDFSKTTHLNIEPHLFSPFHLAIFTRLSPEKPIEPLLESFSLLRNHVDAYLHIFGRGEPEVYKTLINSLGISDRVEFEGHTTSLESAVTSRKIGLVWGLYYGSLGGYAGIELAALGVPLLLWNYSGRKDDDVYSSWNGVIRAYSSPEALATASKNLLEDRASMQELIQAQDKFARHYYDVQRNIPLIERAYEDLG